MVTTVFGWLGFVVFYSKKLFLVGLVVQRFQPSTNFVEIVENDKDIRRHTHRCDFSSANCQQKNPSSLPSETFSAISFSIKSD